MNKLDHVCSGAVQPALPACRLGDLFDDVADTREYRNRRVGSLRLDSRQVEPGSLFFAIPGETGDGRNHITEALERGASAVSYEKRQAGLPDLDKGAVPFIAVDDLRSKISVIAARYYGHPSRHLDLVGVTGTNGKTTFTFLLAQAFELLGRKCGVMGTIGNGYVNAIHKSLLTTGNAIEVQKQLAMFLDDKAQVVCMEVSSHALAQDRVSGVDFDIAVFTNLSQDHLDYHGTHSRYAAAKKKLFMSGDLDLIVVNHDDALGRDILRAHSAHRSITYGLEGGQVVPSNLLVDVDGIHFDIHWADQTLHFFSPLLGKINVPNLLAVIACLLGCGTTIDEIQNILPHLSPPPGRMELFGTTTAAPKVVVDYSHTPDSLQKALMSLRPLTQGRITVVFGCGGERDTTKRAQMGHIAEQYADRIILTDDNPRTESSKEIIRQIRFGIDGAVDIIPDRRQAIGEAICRSRSEDVVLVAGKGHEETQITCDGVIPFSDRAVVNEWLGMSS